MVILGLIMIVVGIALIFVGKNVTSYLSHNYQGGDDGFPELMKSMGNLLAVAGVIFIIAGCICILWR